MSNSNLNAVKLKRLKSHVETGGATDFVSVSKLLRIPAENEEMLKEYLQAVGVKPEVEKPKEELPEDNLDDDLASDLDDLEEPEELQTSEPAPKGNEKQEAPKKVVKEKPAKTVTATDPVGDFSDYDVSFVGEDGIAKKATIKFLHPAKKIVVKLQPETYMVKVLIGGEVVEVDRNKVIRARDKGDSHTRVGGENYSVSTLLAAIELAQ